MTLNPQANTRVGERILKSNIKFWIIYLNLISERLNDFARATLRARLLDPATGLFQGAADRDTLIKEVGAIIEADKLEPQQTAEDSALPVFGMATEQQCNNEGI
jgi:hypothetical protein